MKIKDLHTTADFKRMAADKTSHTNTTARDIRSGVNKFGAQRVTNNNGTFDSKHESRVVDELLRLQQGGYIRDVETDRQSMRYEIKVNDYWICHYTADAKFTASREIEIQTHDGPRTLTPGQTYLVDAKSIVTRKKRDYKLVKSLMRAVHGIKLIEL